MFRFLRSLACGSTLLLAAVAPGQSSLQTTFAFNTLALSGSGIYFDLDVPASAITVTRLDLNLGGSGFVEVYTRNGSRVGAQTSAAGWTLAASVPVANAVAGQPYRLDLPPLVFDQGVHGIALRAMGPSQYMTIGTGSNQNHSNADLTIACGEQSLGLFNTLLVQDRVVNARVYYLQGAAAALPPATGTFTGASCGYRFTAATDFNIRQLGLPPGAFLAGSSASYLLRVNGAVAYRSIGNTGPVNAPVHVNTGDVVDVLANWSTSPAGAASARNMIAATASFPGLVAGTLTTLHALSWTWDIGDPNWTPNGTTGSLQTGGNQFGIVWMTTEPGTETASNLVLGHGCGAAPGSCYEIFASASSFDLANSALTFTPQAGGGYVVSRAGALLPVGATSVPNVLNLSDDSQVTVPFTLGSFPGWPAVTVCSNGFVARANGNGTSYSPSAAAMLAAGEPGFWSWHDYNPGSASSGRVKVEQNVGITVITWDGVYDFAPSASFPNRLQFQLYANGTATIAWGAISGSGNEHLVGYSPGGPSPDLGPTDFSALGSGTLALAAIEQPPLTLAAVSRPVLGSTWNLLVTNLPTGSVIGLDVLGLSDPNLNDLAFLGMPGCAMRASPDVLTAWPVSTLVHARSFAVPSLVALRGLDLFASTLVFNSQPVNAFGAFTSNTIRGHLGDL